MTFLVTEYLEGGESLPLLGLYMGTQHQQSEQQVLAGNHLHHSSSTCLVALSIVVPALSEIVSMNQLDMVLHQH